MSTKRTEILATARKLFAEVGFHAVGVDRIMAEAGTSKRTMYKYFPTKDDLINTVIEEYVAEVKSAFEHIEQAGSARDQISTLFRTVQSFLGSPGLQGCLTVRAMAEFGGSGLAVEGSCQAFKRWEIAEFEALAEGLGAADPKRLALRLTLLYEGMFAYTQVMREAPPMEVIDWVSEILDAETKWAE